MADDKFVLQMNDRLNVIDDQIKKLNQEKLLIDNLIATHRGQTAQQIKPPASPPTKRAERKPSRITRDEVINAALYTIKANGTHATTAEIWKECERRHMTAEQRQAVYNHLNNEIHAPKGRLRRVSSGIYAEKVQVRDIDSEVDRSKT